MAEAIKLGFAALSTPPKGILILFCEEGLKLGPASRKLLAPSGDLLQRAAAADRFTGKAGSALNIVAPAALPVSRLIVIGVGKPAKFKSHDFVKLGGACVGRLPSTATAATIVAEFATGALKPERAADLAHGARLRAYRFEVTHRDPCRVLTQVGGKRLQAGTQP